MLAANLPLWNSIAIERDIVALEAEWRAFEETALGTPYQAYGWVRPFVETVGAAQGLEFRYALLRDGAGALVALLPLVIARKAGVSHAAFIGDKHSNYHMGLYAPAFASKLDTEMARRMLQEVGAAIGLDALIFLNQPCSWQGIANPAALIAAGPSPSRAYKLALLPGDGEATLKRSMSSHARKKLKNKHNRFKDFGPSALVHATTPEEIECVFDAFLAQKAERFRNMGVADPFAERSVRAFLKQAATASDGHRPVVQLYALELGGTCVATYIGAVQGGRFSGMATSFDLSSPTARTSPGEILLSELIRLQSREGLTVFDLGVGEARYKTSFCDDHDDLVDTFLPLTLKGRLFTTMARARRALKRRIKSSPKALKLAQIVAGRLRGKSPEEE
ncbi:GNAT family N-acetyltransferase [Bosea thiooxidans]